jgi:DNA repair exonuclease SbcCD nuclease subunit
MNILVIGDPHLKISNIGNAEKFLNWIVELVEERKPDIVVNLGDTFHDHAVLRSEILGLFRKHFDAIIRLGSDYRYVLGNHDFFKPDSSKYHALQSFKGIQGFTVYDEPSIGDEIGFVPYIPNPEDFPLQCSPITFVHQTFTGAHYGGGYMAPDTEVDFNDVKADLIISGHIHVQQWLGDKVFYPGTPYAQSADDVDQDKGVFMLDTATKAMEFISSPLPMYRKLIVPKGSVSESIDHIVNSVNQQDVWIVDLEGHRAELSDVMFSKSVEELRRSVKIRFRPKYLNSDKQKQKKISTKNMNSVLAEYVDDIYSGNLDKSELKRILSDLVESH